MVISLRALSSYTTLIPSYYRRLRHAGTRFALLFLLSTSASADTDSLLAWLETYTSDLQSTGQLAGVSAAVILPSGEVIAAAAGPANEQGDLITTDSRFLGGSTGKTYVAALVMRLAEQGKLDVSDRVSVYLGDREWFSRIPNAKDITVHSLLNHTSGVPHYIDDLGFMFSYAWDSLMGNSIAYSPEQMLSFILDEPPMAPVGQMHYYSDLNYFLLGLVIEAVTELTYYEALTAQILEPQGLDDVIPQNSRDIERLVNGNASDNLLNTLLGMAGPTMENGRLKRDPSLEWTGGGLATTPRGLAMFFHALGSGAIVSPAGLEQMRSAAVPVAPGSQTGYGYGFFVSEREELGRYLSHSGWFPGYSSNAAWFEDGGFSVAIQVSQDYDVDIYTPIREIAAAVLEHSTPTDTELTLAFEMSNADQAIGSQLVHYQANGRVDIEYQFASQGKHPHVAIEMELNQAGIPVTVSRRGKAFLYHDIDEHFARTATGAVWRSRTEKGDTSDSEGHFYIPFSLLDAGASAPAEIAILAAALLANPERSLPLLPDGGATLEILGRERVTANDGSQRVVQLVAISGLHLQPVLQWLDLQGRPFAELGWSTMALPEFRHSLDGMRTAQASASALARDQLSATLADASHDSRSRAILVRGARLFDSTSGALTNETDVRITDGRIAAVGTDLVEGNALVINADGHTLLPGLWDMHVHVTEESGPMYLAAGVTTVRDMANDTDRLAAIKEQFDSGARHGPRLLRAGYIDKKGPLQTPAGLLVDSLDEALTAVDDYASQGYRQIKLYGAIEADWVAPIGERAHQQGLRLSGHVPIQMSTRQALEDGYDEVSHFVFMWLNFAEEPVARELTFNAARIADRVAYDSPDMRSLVKLFAQQDAALDPTMAVYEEFIQGVTGEMYPAYLPYRDVLPLQVRRQSTAGPLQIPADLDPDTYHSLFDQGLALIGEMDANNVQVLTGTDHRWLPGLAMARELELLHEAGISRGRVLQMATLEPARLMGMDAEFGSVATGKVADLLLVEGDPTADLGALRDVSWVFKDGIAYPAEALQEAIGLGANSSI